MGIKRQVLQQQIIGVYNYIDDNEAVHRITSIQNMWKFYGTCCALMNSVWSFDESSAHRQVAPI